MNCNKVSQLLSAYMDGELMGYEHRHINQHLQRCPRCSNEYEGLLQMKRMLSAMRLREPSEDLSVSIIHRVTAEESAQEPDWRMPFPFIGGRGPLYSPMVGLGLGLTCIGVGLLLQPRSHPYSYDAGSQFSWERADPSKDQRLDMPHSDLVQGLAPQQQTRVVSYRPANNLEFGQFSPRSQEERKASLFGSPLPFPR